MDQNLNIDNKIKFLQRKVCYDSLPSEVLPKLRELSKDKGRVFLEDLDQLFSNYDRDVNPNVEGTGSKRAGVGIFYFEEK